MDGPACPSGSPVEELLEAALSATSVMPSSIEVALDQYPVIAFGAAATMVMNLSYAGWVSTPRLLM